MAPVHSGGGRGLNGHCNRRSRCILSAVRQADEDIADLVFNQKVFAGARDMDNRLAQVVAAYFEVGPLHLATPASAERFEDGFLGCPPASEVFDGPGFTMAVVDFVRCEDALQEDVAMLGNHPSDACAFNDVGAEAKDVHGVIVYTLHTPS